LLEVHNAEEDAVMTAFGTTLIAAERQGAGVVDHNIEGPGSIPG